MWCSVCRRLLFSADYYEAVPRWQMAGDEAARPLTMLNTAAFSPPIPSANVSIAHGGEPRILGAACAPPKNARSPSSGFQQWQTLPFPV